jgi:hypothetical protein
VPSQGYFEVAAQVLPVLLLVLLVEYRVFGTPWREPAQPDDPLEVPLVEALLAVFSGALFVAAESSALGVLEERRASDWDRDVVSAALTFYLAMTVVVPFHPYFEALFERIPVARRLRLRIARASRRDNPDHD